MLENSGNNNKARTRLADLRREMVRRGIDGFMVPRADQHMGEYVAACGERLAWLTGFTGSAGSSVVLSDTAAIFTDGRYTSQLNDQADAALYEFRHSIDQPPKDWIAENLGGRSLGYDPWLHTPAQAAQLSSACAKAGGKLVALEDNLIDAIWSDQPDPPLGRVIAHGLEFAGLGSLEKRVEIGRKLKHDQIDAVVLSAPDSISWLLNIRGSDIDVAPLVLAFAILGQDGTVELFIDDRKLDDDVRHHLGDDISVLDPQALGPALDKRGAGKQTVAFDPTSAACWIEHRLIGAGANLVERVDPCQLPKAIRNDVELAGVRAAHLRDGVALVSFLAWLDREAPGGGVTEISAVENLEAMRRRDPLYLGASFPTISGAAGNGAIVHYRVSEASNRKLEWGSLYLVDSGGQYRDGTTDVTRTIAIGPASDEMRDRFTRVLKGHIAIATALFPAGVTGSQLDPLARRALWQVGLDYDHGTGHGVGCYLSVHEGPQRIGKASSTVALQPGMVISNEPGYYKTGAYGIRIENLTVVEARTTPQGAEHDLLGFSTLSLAPIDLNLVDTALLNRHERKWLDQYHKTVRGEITPLVDEAVAIWLAQATRPCINESE
ncbi:MAG TPA: aminopeptidase P family protein [Rhodospirillales bacterium]|nr:aminopeptidase P family protein [Rhodospirillales bacterium]